MVYRRKGTKRYSFEARTRTGHKQLPTGTTDKVLAGRMAAMWERLAERERAWDVLDRVLVGELAVSALWDAWVRSEEHLPELRRRLADVDLVPLVEPWLATAATQYPADTVAHLTHHVRTLLPAGAVVRGSSVTTAWLSAQLAAYHAPSRRPGGAPVPVRRNTRRKVHSSWSQFFDYVSRVHGVYPTNPMLAVDRPAQERSPIRFYELPQVERIVGYQASAEMRTLFALLYGSGADLSPALTLTRDEVDVATQSARVMGTKAHTRDRVSRIAEWAWPIIWAHVRTLLPGAPLFPTLTDRHLPSKVHGRTVKALGLPRYPLRNSRDHWAVRMLRSGTPVAVVQHQLGHASPMLTLMKYGRFLPEASDRAYWEDQATQADLRRRTAI
jgi:integrase